MIIEDIVNQTINQYTGSISNIQSGSITLGKELFNSIALISIAVLGFNHLLRKNTDLSDANIELIKWLVYLDFFYAFITNFASIYSFVFSAIQQIAQYLGDQAAGTPVDISSANVFHIGIQIALKILGSNITLNLFRNILYPLTSLVTAAIILYCFAAIGLELILVQIGSQIILMGGVFLLAFSGFQWTRDYAERYVHTFFHVGIKMVFMYILVGLGIGLSQGWSNLVVNASWDKVLEYDLGVCLSAYIYYKLCLKLPDQAVTWLTGRLSMGFDAATDVKAGVGNMVKTAHAAYKLAAGIPGQVKGFEAGQQGNKMAYDSAMKFTSARLQAEGKKFGPEELKKETIKTLGEAKWNKVVAATDGGKLATTIDEDFKKFQEEQAKVTPKPQPAPAPLPTPGPDNNSMDPSI